LVSAVRRHAVQLLVLLAAYGGIVLWFPEATVSPGDLVGGHQDIAADCFRCHSVFRGTPQEKCVACHEIAAIGLRLTSGVPIARTEQTPPFHQALLESECIACHSDHLGTGRPGANALFTHEVLRKDVLASCGDCHGDSIPKDDLHRAAPHTCGSCHGFEAWKPATFDHALLASDRQRMCIRCHADVRPSDDLHRQAGDACETCHGTKAWKPATFEHQEYFRFDRNHPGGKCQSCHPETLDRYTCYGCHEHTPRSIAGEHREEGIADFEDCVKCHRSGDEDEAEKRFRGSHQSRSAHDD
jgi:hypothetical protein